MTRSEFYTQPYLTLCNNRQQRGSAATPATQTQESSVGTIPYKVPITAVQVVRQDIVTPSYTLDQEILKDSEDKATRDAISGAIQTIGMG
jgi:hypothetical protein